MGLASAGYSGTDLQQLAALGAQFQDSAKAHDATLQIPDSGYVFHNLYTAYFQDPDIGNASYNFSTAVLPFSLVAACGGPGVSREIARTATCPWDQLPRRPSKPVETG